MSTDISSKIQNALWWITSIATAVVCCSIIFVLFASYFVDIRQDIKDGNIRIHSIEEREDRILAEIEMIRKHGLGPMMTSPPAAEAPAAPAQAPAAPAPEPAVETTPTPLAPTAAPAAEAPAVAPAPNAQPVPPAAPVPPVVAPSMAPAPASK